MILVGRDEQGSSGFGRRDPGTSRKAGVAGTTIKLKVMRLNEKEEKRVRSIAEGIL